MYRAAIWWWLCITIAPLPPCRFDQLAAAAGAGSPAELVLQMAEECLRVLVGVSPLMFLPGLGLIVVAAVPLCIAVACWPHFFIQPSCYPPFAADGRRGPEPGSSAVRGGASAAGPAAGAGGSRFGCRPAGGHAAAGALSRPAAAAARGGLPGGLFGVHAWCPMPRSMA